MLVGGKHVTERVRHTKAQIAIRGKLAVENARRNPRRTAATATTLMVGLAMVTAVTVAVASLNRMDEQEVDHSMTSDLRITAVDFGAIGEDTAARVGRLADAKAATPVYPDLFRRPATDFLAVYCGRPRHGGTAAPLSPSARGRWTASAMASPSPRNWPPSAAGGSAPASAAPSPARADVRGHPTACPSWRSTTARTISPPPSSPTAPCPARPAPRQRPDIDSVLVKAAPGRTAALRREIRRALDNPALLVRDHADARAAATRGLGAVPEHHVRHAQRHRADRGPRGGQHHGHGRVRTGAGDRTSAGDRAGPRRRGRCCAWSR